MWERALCLIKMTFSKGNSKGNCTLTKNCAYCKITTVVAYRQSAIGDALFVVFFRKV